MCVCQLVCGRGVSVCLCENLLRLKQKKDLGLETNRENSNKIKDGLKKVAAVIKKRLV